MSEDSACKSNKKSRDETNNSGESNNPKINMCGRYRYPHQKLPSAIKCSSEHKTRVEPDPKFCCCTHEQTYQWTLAIKLFQKSRDKLEKRSAESQEPTKTADCRKWETDTGNGVQKKQQMKPSSSSTSSTRIEGPPTLDWFRCNTPPKYEDREA